ncbi:hypothetical protein MUN84_20420 [Hymenobacter sp. 5516J-16]|uniref:hypothetical protein n=1 Tax=Hymenobacter sp. 5516J-16 TaxID=2932253 RepID=UPI001FD0ED2B|nr:hypothetical protein [Hymenobacter sp. 5516J-16]UOQ76835.1 hypothetical protein MUN84_20420 [Hymenobacter sp. 5516J-16]
MRPSFLKFFLPLAVVAGLTTAAINKPHQGINLFSINQDIALGAQVAKQTDSLYRAKGSCWNAPATLVPTSSSMG